MSKLLHYPDYLGDALKMFFDNPTLQQRGAYYTLRIALLQNDGYLDDDDTLYFKCMCFSEEDKQMLKQMISKCLSKKNGKYYSDEVISLIDRQKSIRDKRAEAGKKGGTKSRRNKQKGKQSESESESEIEIESEPNKNLYTPEFEFFWNEYGKVGTKKTAAKAYRAAKKKTDDATLLGKLSEYKRYLGERDWLDQCHASTWLNEERWNNEYHPAEQNQTPSQIFEQLKREGKI